MSIVVLLSRSPSSSSSPVFPTCHQACQDARMKPTEWGQEAVNADLQRRLSNLVRMLIPCSRLPQFPYLTYIFTAEATQNKENAKREAAKRADQRKKKKAIMQQKAAQREQAGRSNGRNRTLLMLGFHSFLLMVLTLTTRTKSPPFSRPRHRYWVRSCSMS